MLSNTIKKKLIALNKHLALNSESGIVKRANEVGANEVGANEVVVKAPVNTVENTVITNTVDLDANEVGTHEVGTNEVGTNEVDANEIDFDDTETTEHIYTHYTDMLNKAQPPKQYTKARVCMYKINADDLYPFTMFLLYKNSDNVLDFAEIDYVGPNASASASAGTDPNADTGTTIVNHVLAQFKQIFEDWQVTIEYKGFWEEKDNLILVLKYNEITDKDNDSPPLRKYASKWWWVLATEIINYKYVLNFKVADIATTFLINNYKLCLLYDAKVQSYDMPDVGYFGDYYKVIVAAITLGINRRSIYASCGPYYYFSNYKGAMRNAIFSFRFGKPKLTEHSKTYLNSVDERGHNKKGGIVKFALFLQKTKMLLGREFDANDDSAITLNMAKNSEFIAKSLKLRDNSAKWIENYNSVRVGSYYIKLTDAPGYYTDPTVTLKEYNQQVPLEYYYVDTTQDVDKEQTDKVNIM